jgi:CheY-like chemotaxis protein
LQRAGYDPVGVADGKEAWEVLEQGGIDFLVTDVNMEQVNGPELIAMMNSAGYAIPVLVLTTYSFLDEIPQYNGPLDVACKLDGANHALKLIEKLTSEYEL